MYIPYSSVSISNNLVANQIYYLKHQHYKNDEQKKKIKRSECPYKGIDCAWCTEDCE